MAKVLTGLELKAVTKELQSRLPGAHLNKIYQPESKTLLLGFRKEGEKPTLKIDSGVGAYITTHDYKTQDIPPSFCMFLRKHLMNSRLLGLEQHGAERILEFKFQAKEGERILITELFGNGNFLLCDGNYVILNSAISKVFKDRTVKRGEKYDYPPSKFDILQLNQGMFLEALGTWKDHEVVRMLASGLGLGGTYAEEICVRAKIDKKKLCSRIDKTLGIHVFSKVKTLLAEFENPSGFLYSKEDDLRDATPVEMKSYSNFETKTILSFNEAVDALFASLEGEKVLEKATAEFEKELTRLKQRLDIQKASLEDYKNKWHENQRVADEIYNNFHLISVVLDKIGSALRMGYNWEDIRSVLEQEREKGIREAILIKEMRPEENKVVVGIAGGVELNVRKTAQANAEVYYSKAKSSKAKIVGAERIVNKTEREIQSLIEKKGETEEEAKKNVPKPIEVVKREWYEKFHWFFTSSGLLAIGGRDATQNEIVIKKHVEIGDIIFHTESPGSPFFVLKEGRDKATDKDKEEVAIATASYSRAWGAGHSTTDVYWVRPEQVSKEAKAGEYIPKGAFMVRGKKNFYRGTALQLCIGIDKKGKIIAGPASAIAKHGVKSVRINIGDRKKSDTAKAISKQLETNKLDDIIRKLPSGSFAVLSA